MARSSDKVHPKMQDMPPYQLKKNKTYKVRKQVRQKTRFGKIGKLNLPASGVKKNLTATQAAAEIKKIKKEAGSKFPKIVFAAVFEE